MLNIYTQSETWGAYGFSKRAAIHAIVELRLKMSNARGKGNAAKRRIASIAHARYSAEVAAEKAAKRQQQYIEMCRETEAWYDEYQRLTELDVDTMARLDEERQEGRHSGATMQQIKGGAL